MIIQHGAVAKPEDVFFNSFGSLVWQVEDFDDKTEGKRVIYLDGHTDTGTFALPSHLSLHFFNFKMCSSSVAALRESWHQQAGEGVDPYLGLIDKDKVNEAFIRKEIGSWIPPKVFTSLLNPKSDQSFNLSFSLNFRTNGRRSSFSVADQRISWLESSRKLSLQRFSSN